MTPWAPLYSLGLEEKDILMCALPESTALAGITEELALAKEAVSVAAAAFAKGEMVLVGDDEGRENEVDLMFPAFSATTEQMAFATFRARGLVCVSVEDGLAAEIGLYTAPRSDGSDTGFTLSVDARAGITSGISAKDRAQTARLLGTPGTTIQDFASPGHLFPIRAHRVGLLGRQGHTEAAQELCLRAGVRPAAVLCEMLQENGEALCPCLLLEARRDSTSVFHHIPYVTTRDLFWNKIFWEMELGQSWTDTTDFVMPPNGRVPRSITSLKTSADLHMPCLCIKYAEEFAPETIRVVVSNGLVQWDNGVSQKDASAEFILWSWESSQESFADFLPMFANKELNATWRRILTLKLCLHYLKNTSQKASSAFPSTLVSPFVCDNIFLNLP